MYYFFSNCLLEWKVCVLSFGIVFEKSIFHINVYFYFCSHICCLFFLIGILSRRTSTSSTPTGWNGCTGPTVTCSGKL